MNDELTLVAKLAVALHRANRHVSSDVKSCPRGLCPEVTGFFRDKSALVVLDVASHQLRRER